MSERNERERWGRGVRKLRPYLPNRSSRMALVSLDDERPFRAHWPLTLVQIVGCRAWSISFVRYATPSPVTTYRPTATEQEATE